MPADIRTLLELAVEGPPAAPPGDLAHRARRRLQRRRLLAVSASVAAALAVAVPVALVEAREGHRRPAGIAGAVRDGELTTQVSLDGGRLLLDPYRGGEEVTRRVAETEFRSAERIFWAGSPATDLEVRLTLATVTVDEPAASFRGEPAWVALYRYRPVAFGCPMQSRAEPVAALPDDAHWHAFVLPLGGAPAFLWHGQGTGACGRLPAPQVEAARKHLSAAWRESSRAAAAAVIAVDVPCDGTLDEIRGPDPQTGELRVVVSVPTTTTPSSCAAPSTVTRSVGLPRPDFALLPSPVGVLDGETPGAAPADAPELGRVVTPEGVRRTLPRGLGRGAPPPPGPTVDLLARHVDGGITVGTYGWVQDGRACLTRFVDRPSPGQSSPEPAACGPVAQDWDRLAVSRSLGLRPAGQLKQVLWGFAPAGTDRVRLTGPGQQELVVPVYDAGGAWRHALHFAATWPSDAPATVAALASDGRQLAQTTG